MILAVALYLIAGFVWAIWLENFTTKELEHPYNQPWETAERVFHSVLWPYSFSVFLYSFLEDFFKNIR